MLQDVTYYYPNFHKAEVRKTKRINAETMNHKTEPISSVLTGLSRPQES